MQLVDIFEVLQLEMHIYVMVFYLNVDFTSVRMVLLVGE